MIAPKFKELSVQYPDVTFLKVNVEECEVGICHEMSCHVVRMSCVSYAFAIFMVVAFSVKFFVLTSTICYESCKTLLLVDRCLLLKQECKVHVIM